MSSEKSHSTIKINPISEDEHIFVIKEKDADAVFQFIQKHKNVSTELTPEIESKLLKKNTTFTVLLIGFCTLCLYLDKATMNYSSILGLFADTGLNTQKFNNTTTLFYVGYLVGQVPGQIGVQKLPLGKFVAAIAFTWSVIIFLHCAATSYAGFALLRLALGFTEAIMEPLNQQTFAMFLDTHTKSTVQPLFWIACGPIPTIFCAFVSYGLLYHESSLPIAPWKIFHIIIGSISFLLFIVSFFYYPDNPTNAKWLTDEEKVQTIYYIQKYNKTGIEQKQIKKYQIVECVTDPITWLYTLVGFLLMLCNNMNYQNSLIITGIGVSKLGSTLVSLAGGCFGLFTFSSYAFANWKLPNNSHYIGAFTCLPSFCCAWGMIFLPWSHEKSLLACLIICGYNYGICTVTSISLATSTASGYTKRITRLSIYQIFYSVSNIIGPQMWRSKYAPRYYPPWSVMLALSWFAAPIVMLVIRQILFNRNQERIELIEKGKIQEVGEIITTDEDGKKIVTKVDNSLLDLTDLENKSFIYPL